MSNSNSFMTVELNICNTDKLICPVTQAGSAHNWYSVSHMGKKIKRATSVDSKHHSFVCEAATVNGHHHEETKNLILCPTREFSSDLIGLLEVAADWTLMAITGRLGQLTHDAGLADKTGCMVTTHRCCAAHSRLLQ